MLESDVVKATKKTRYELEKQIQKRFNKNNIENEKQVDYTRTYVCTLRKKMKFKKNKIKYSGKKILKKLKERVKLRNQNNSEKMRLHQSHFCLMNEYILTFKYK